MPNLAIVEVWALLQSRRDTTNILREILGEYTLSVIGKPAETVLALSFRLFVWTKVLFDRQRTYSQNIKPSPESISRLVDPNTLFTTILHILDIRFRVYSRGVGVSEEYVSQRCFIAGVVLSGLRAVLLREWSFTANEIEDMQAQILDWKRSAGRYNLEAAILAKCHYALDTMLSSVKTRQTSDIKVHMPACDVLELPDSEEGLFPLRLRTDDVFKNELRGLRDNNERSFWVLFDILWAAEGAVIQKAVAVNEYATLLDTERGEEACLKAVLLEWCSGSPSSQQEVPRWAQQQALQTYLGHFQNFLESRNAKLLASQVEISGLSSRLGESIESWFISASGIPRHELRGKSQTAYLLHCPKLHVIPVHVLESFMARPNAEGSQSRARLSADSNLLEVQFTCPQCDDGEHLVRRARRIEPLDELSKAVEQIINRSAESQHWTFTDPFTEDARRSTITDPSSIETRRPSSIVSMPQSPSSGSQSTAETIPSNSGSNRRTLLARLSFGRVNSNTEAKPPKTRATLERLPTSHKFSADGGTLLLWTEHDNFVFVSAVPEVGRPCSALEGRKCVVEDIRQAAGGGDLIAAVSGKHRLLVFSLSQGDTAILDTKITAVDETDAVRSVAVCPTGNFVAFGLDKRVIIWDFQNRNATSCNTFPLSKLPGQKFDSQMISFSQDGNQVITATRDSEGIVQLSVCNNRGQKTWSRKGRPTQSMTTDNQLGLSSVFYDSNTNYAIITAFINKSYFTVQSKAADLELKGWSRDAVYKFQAAAQSPSGSIFTLADAYGQLYTLDTGTCHITEGNKLLHRCSAKSRDDMMAMAMPDDNTIYACWNEDGKIVLATVTKGRKKVDILRINSLI